MKSKIGKGAAFHVLLPCIEAAPEEEIQPSYYLPEGNERILYVDDEKAIVDVYSLMLERLGYNVTSTMNGLEALETFRSRPYQFDLVITDQTMPHMTGEDLSKELMTIRSDIPIILCTGFSELINREKAKSISKSR